MPWSVPGSDFVSKCHANQVNLIPILFWSRNLIFPWAYGAKSLGWLGHLEFIKYGYGSLLHMSFNHGHRSGVFGDFRPLCLLAPFCVFHCLLQFSPCTNIQVSSILHTQTVYIYLWTLCTFRIKINDFCVWWTSIDWTMLIRNHKDFRNKKCPIFHWRSN